MTKDTLNQIDDFLASLNDTNGGILSWATVDVNGAKVLLVSENFGMLDLQDLGNTLTKGNN